MNSFSLALLITTISFCGCQSPIGMSMTEAGEASSSCSTPLSLASVAGDSASSSSELLPTVSGEPSDCAVVLASSSGARVRFERSGGAWKASLSPSSDAYAPCHRLAIASSPGTDIGATLSWLRGAGFGSSRSRVHMLSSSASPTGVASVYLGKLGLMGGMNRPPAASSFTAAPVWLEPTREKQFHDVVTVSPGQQVRIPYAVKPGWRCLSYRLHTIQKVQEISDVGCYIEPLQANFSFSRSGHQGFNQHHALDQGVSGPSVSIPMVPVEADISVGRHSQQAQGAQQYTDDSVRTTHDVLVLYASVPSEIKKKRKNLPGYKTKPVTTSLKVQLEVILERISVAPPVSVPPLPVSPSPASFATLPGVSTPVSPPVSSPSQPSVSQSSPVRSTSVVPSRPSHVSRPQSSHPLPSQTEAVFYTPDQLEALLSRKLAHPDEELSDSESIALLTHCVRKGEENAENIKGKDAVIVIGNTGAGKSTFLNYLLGCEMMKKSPRELGMKGVGKVVVVKSRSEGGCLDEVMPIGHANTSKTFIPQIQADFQDTSLVYCDCPGFLDNRGAEINIANAVNIRRLLQSSKCVKVLVLINYHSLKADRGRGLREMLQICTQLFGSGSQLSRRKDSLLLGLTQVPSDDADLLGLRDWLLEGTPAVMTALCEHLFLYDPIGGSAGDYLSRSACMEALRNLKSIPQRESGKLFHTVLTDSDELKLLEIVEKQGKQLRDHLRGKRYGQAAQSWQNLNRLRVIDHISVERILNDNHLKIQKMLSRRIAIFRDNSVHYRFDLARAQLSVLQSIASHFSEDDLSLLELDIPELSRHLSYFISKEAEEHHREARIASLEEQKRLIGDQLSQRAREFEKERSRLRAEMVRRDADHEAQIGKIQEEQETFIQKQTEAVQLQKTMSEEERAQHESEQAHLRQAYEARLKSAEQERATVRAEYEELLAKQESSKKASESALKKKIAEIERARRQVSLPSAAFGVSAWKEYFGVNVPSAPQSSTDAALRTWHATEPAPFLLEGEDTKQRVSDNCLLTLIPSTVDGVPFTLDKLGALILGNHNGHMAAFQGKTNQELGKKSHGYRYYSPSLTGNQREEPLSESSYWLLLPKTILANSRNKNRSKHKKLVSVLGSGYRMPHALEAATSLLAHYAKSGERLYVDSSWTYTRCLEVDKNGHSFFVGGFESSGLSIDSDDDSYDYGVSSCRKF